MVPSTWVTSTAPNIPPRIPGTSKRMNNALLTLPNLTWEIPETPVVKISAICTLALATPGVAPVANRNEVAVTPYAIPKAPSTTCAKNPTITAVQNSLPLIVSPMICQPPNQLLEIKKRPVKNMTSAINTTTTNHTAA